METIEEEPETAEEIKTLEENMFQEIVRSLNDIDSQLMSLLVQRKLQYKLLKNVINKYNKNEYKLSLNINNRIRTNYDYNYETQNYLINIYKYL
jgi:hypothetical protein